MDAKSSPPSIEAMPKIRSYDEVDSILRSRDFEQGQFETESWPFRGESLIELDGHQHFERRRLQSALFSRAALFHYEQKILSPAVDRCIHDLVTEPDGSASADLVALTRRMLIEIAAAVIGLDGVDTPERAMLLQSLMYPLNEAVDVKWSTRDHAEVVREGHTAKVAFIDEFYAPAAARRETLVKEHHAGNVPDEDLPLDLITLMLLHRSEDWDEGLIARESILYLAGATFTTSAATSHAVTELDRWLRSHPEDEARLDDPTFLRGVCNETLRLHAGIPALVRRAKVDTTLADGTSVPAGECVALNIGAANRDPDVYGADAEDFDPRRRHDSRRRPYGLAFGGGRHVCIGRPLVTTIQGDLAEEGDTDRIMLQILRSLYQHGLELDADRSPELFQTYEEVYRILPVRFTNLAGAACRRNAPDRDRRT